MVMTKQQTISEFLDALSSKQPVPGGGGASALAGALGTALGLMVGNLTVGKKKYAQVEAEVVSMMGRLTSMQREMMELADEDAHMGFRQGPKRRKITRQRLWRLIFWRPVWCL